MENNYPETPSSSRSPFFSLALVIAFVFIGLFVGNFVALLAVLPFFDYEIGMVTQFLGNPFGHGDGRVPLLIVQGISSFFSFIIAPFLYIKIYEPKVKGELWLPSNPMALGILFAVVVSLSFMFVNSPIIEWNMNLDFPDFMKSFEDYARRQEDFLKQITDYVTTFDGVGQFVLGMIVIAVIPGIGEELVFRGLIQNKLVAIFKNPHAGIWVAGFLFGLFHFQFYGMVPRMLLGVLFGYLYWWSGSLILAMVGHFVNNGFSLIMVYLYQQGLIDFDIEGTEQIAFSTVVISTILFMVLMSYFLKSVKFNPPDYE